LIPPVYRRHAIGIIALVLVLIGVVLRCTPAKPVGTVELEATCLRIGPLLAAVWLAYDQLKRVPLWAWIASPVLLIVVARWPRALWVLIPALVAVAILKPKARTRR
jgi:hypothetical protein